MHVQETVGDRELTAAGGRRVVSLRVRVRRGPDTSSPEPRA